MIGGIRVISQFNVTRYYIDPVVEEIQGRLAVGCDGEWHGPERYAEDMGRQGDIGRCGFRRVRGSTFNRDPGFRPRRNVWCVGPAWNPSSQSGYTGRLKQIYHDRIQINQP